MIASLQRHVVTIQYKIRSDLIPMFDERVLIVFLTSCSFLEIEKIDEWVWKV